MPQLFYKDGAPIPEEHIPDAIASGQAFAKSQRVAVRDSSGNVGTITPADLGNPNYTVLSDAEISADRIHRERSTVGQQAITAAEGAARGASLGLSDVALTHALGDDYRKGALERTEENRKLATVSEIGGAVLPGLLTGGAATEAEGAALAARAGSVARAAEEGSVLSRGVGAAARVIGAPVKAVSKLGGVAERGASSLLEGLGLGESTSLAGRAAAKAVKLGAAGATEGAVFGAGSALSESTLQGDPLTSEALVAGMGRGALFGGVLGAGAGALSEAAPALLKKALPSAERLDEAAVGFARRQLGRDFENVGKGQSREVAEQWKNANAKQLLYRKLVGGENAGKTVFEVSRKPADIADNLGQMQRDIGEEIGATHAKASALIDASPHLAPNPEELIARLEAKAAEFQKQNNTGAYSQARAMRSEIKALRNAVVDPVAVAPAADGLGAMTPANDVAPSFGYDRIRSWQQDLETQLNPANTPKAMRGTVVKNLEARQAVSDIANDYIKESAARVFAESGAPETNVLQRLNQEYAGTLSMKSAAEKEAKRVASNRRASLTDHMLGIGSALVAMSSGNVGALATMGLGAAAAIGNKIAREQGNAIMAQIARKAAGMTGIVDSAAQALALTGEKLTGSVKALEQSTVHERPYVPFGAVALRNDFEQARDRVRELSTPEHQQAQIAHAISNIQPGFPEAATGMAQQIIRVHQHLAAAIPAQPGGTPMSPLANPAPVPPREMQRFLTKANAALHPEQVIKDLAKGKLDDDAVATLREVYPSTFAQLQQRVMHNVAANKELLPYPRVVHLSKVFGFDGDSSLSPARLPGIQQAIQQINAPPPNAQAPGKPGPTKRAEPGRPKLGKPYNLPGDATAGSK